MKRIMLMAEAVAIGLTAVAEDVRTLNGDWATRPPVWTDESGAVVDWQDGARVRVTAMFEGNYSMPEPIACQGIVFDCAARANFFWNDGHPVSIGAGGLEFRQAGHWGCGHTSDTAANARVRLTADQTWKGLPSGAYSDVNIGWNYDNAYWRLPLGLDADVRNFALEGMLRLWLFSYANDFSNVDVTVKAPARLMVVRSLADAGVETDGRLRARRLRLVGDGAATLPLGGTTPWHLNSLTMGLHAVLDPEHFAETLELADGADISPGAPITLSITNLCVTGGGESVLSGDWTVARPRTDVTFSGGAVLNQAGRFSEAEPGAAIRARGMGTLKVSLAGFGLTGGLDLGEETAVALTGVGPVPTLVGGAAIRVAAGDGGFVYLGAKQLAGFTGTRIVVESGTLVLDAPLSAVSVETAGTGQVVYASADGDLVTDVARTEPVLEVGTGRTLKVFGEGLTAATTLALAGEGEVVFHCSTTLASPVKLASSGAKCRLRTAGAAVTATVAGALDVPDGASLTVAGPGEIVFAGGGDFHDSGALGVRDNAAVAFTQKTYAFGAHASLDTGDPFDGYFINCGRRVCVRNGGVVDFASADRKETVSKALGAWAPCNYAAWDVRLVVEVGADGRLNLGSNRSFSLSGWGGSACLKLSGGTLSMADWSYLWLGYGGLATGTFEFSGGVLEQRTAFHINNGPNNAFVNWTGGTWKILPGEFQEGGLFRSGLQGDGKSQYVAVAVNGDCTMDLSAWDKDEIANITGTSNRGEWYGNGRLTVRGGKTFVLKSVPNGIDLVLEGEGTQVRIDDDSRIFDYAVCATNCVPRNPQTTYDSSGAQLEHVTFRSLTVSDGAAAFVNQAAARAVAVAEAVVAAGGVWDNAVTVQSARRTVGELVFQENAVWRTSFVDGAAPVLTLEGALALPAALKYAVIRQGTLPARLIEADSVTGTPTWTNVGKRRGVLPKVFADGLGLERLGLISVIR